MKNKPYRNYALEKVIQCGYSMWSPQAELVPYRTAKVELVNFNWQASYPSLASRRAKEYEQMMGLLSCSNVKKESNNSKHVTQKY